MGSGERARCELKVVHQTASAVARSVDLNSAEWIGAICCSFPRARLGGG